MDRSSCEDDISVPGQSASTTETDEEINEKYQNCVARLEELKELHLERIGERKLLQKITLNKQISEFLNTHVTLPLLNIEEKSDSVKECILEDERLHIKKLLEINESMKKKVLAITTKNSSLDKTVMNKKVYLQELIQKRKYLWNKAVKIYEHDDRKNSELENTDVDDNSIMPLSRSSSIDLEDGTKLIKQEIVNKFHRLTELSRILHLLITFSGVHWTDDDDVLRLVLCTGKVLNIKLKNQSVFKSEIDDVLHRLNCIKI